MYAIEAGEIADVEEALIESNGLADRITVLLGWSTQLTLPEQADVRVSEMIGSQPLGERVLELTRDAYERHLKEGARTVPGRVRILGVPIPHQEGEIVNTTFTLSAAERWLEWYGLDFSAVAQWKEDEVRVARILDREVRDLGAIVPPVLFGEIDLFTNHELVFEASATTTVNQAGSVGAVAIYFELGLAAGIQLSNAPEEADGTNHWALPIGVLLAPVEVEVGDELEIFYRFGGMEAELRCTKTSGRWAA